MKRARDILVVVLLGLACLLIIDLRKTVHNLDRQLPPLLTATQATVEKVGGTADAVTSGVGDLKQKAGAIEVTVETYVTRVLPRIEGRLDKDERAINEMLKAGAVATHEIAKASTRQKEYTDASFELLAHSNEVLAHADDLITTTNRQVELAGPFLQSYTNLANHLNDPQGLPLFLTSLGSISAGLDKKTRPWFNPAPRRGVKRILGPLWDLTPIAKSAAETRYYIVGSK